MVSPSPVGIGTPSSPEAGLLTNFPCSREGKRIPHEHLQHQSFPWAAVLPKLPQGGSFRNRLLQHGCPAGSQTLLQHRLPEGSQPPLGMSLLQPGLLPGLQVDLCSSMGCRNTVPLASAAPLPLLLPDLGTCRAFSLTFSHSGASTIADGLGHGQHRVHAALAPSDLAEPSSSFHSSHPHSPPCCQTQRKCLL